MRISDWSSDVCSSDLSLVRHFPVNAVEVLFASGHIRFYLRIFKALLDGFLDLADHFLAVAARSLDRLCNHAIAHGVDRQSVVSGKSVSVLVDLGGRSIIKHNNNTQQSQNVIMK